MSDARIDDLIGKVAHELLTSPRRRNNFGNWGVQESQVSILGTVGYGPTMFLKVERVETSCVIMQARHVRG